MSLIFRGVVILAVLLSAERAYAQVCSPGSTRSCYTEIGGCVGRETCVPSDPDRPYLGEWGPCALTRAPQPCGECGTGGYAVCNQRGVLGPCRPATPLGGEVCGNACDDNNSGVADEGCAGSETFDYCEPKPGGGYTRWTCACGDGLKVGYCLGSADAQSSCGTAEGCLKAPDFGTTGATQAGGNFRCCVSSLPCSQSGYVDGEFQCEYGGAQVTPYECTPRTSCADSNQCGDTCQGLTPTFNQATGQVTGQGSACRPGDYSNACTAAQGGLGSSMGSGGVRAMEDREACVTTRAGGVIESVACVEDSSPSTTPAPGYTLHYNRPRENTWPASGGGGGGRGRGSGGAGPSPAKNQCVPAGGGVTGSALAKVVAPGISLSDLTTRHTQVDVSVQGSVGGLSFVRKYVSSDSTWKYLSMLSNDDAPFLPSPFGASPSDRNSLRWWHGLYSFVRPRGFAPGVSTWAVRDSEGAILEYTACDPGTTGCFATPRPTTRWSTAQLFWTGGASGSFILTQPGMGRFVYASVWQPPQSSFPGRFFLTRVEDEVLSGSGSPRVRLTLQYAVPPLSDCPGLGVSGSAAPYLDTVTTADGAQLKLYYKQVKSLHSAPVGSTQEPKGKECVLDRLALRNDPNAGSTAETVVTRFHYVQYSGQEYAGALRSVSYPETGDVITYNNDGSTSWSVSANDQQVGAHTYSDGKVSSVTTASGSVMSMGTSTAGCSLAQSTGSTSCTPAATQSRTAGDSAGSYVAVRRTYHAAWTSYLPQLHAYGHTDSCVSGNCMSFASGQVINSWEDLPGGFRHDIYVQHKRYDNESQGYLRTVYMPVVSSNSSAAPSVPQLLASVTRAIGVPGGFDPQTGVYSERTEYGYGSPAAGAPPEPFNPLVTERDVRASILVSGQETATTASYDGLTHRLKSVIKEGYTERFDSVTGAWHGPVKAYVGTFYFNHHKCTGQSDIGDARVMEVHGPCEVSGPGATDCTGTDFPITQYHYYGPPGVEPSNRANRLWKVKNFVSHGGATSCSGSPALETVVNSYDARGNATQITNPGGMVATFLYQGGRLDRTTVNGVETHYLYDGAHLTAVQSPTGGYSVRCYRKSTAPGTACNTGIKTDHVQWEAIAADPQGVDWSEAVVYTRWPTSDAQLKSAAYRTRSGGGVLETRRVVEYHPDPQGRPTYTRFGTGNGSFANVAAFDKNDNPTAVGLPFNGPPDFCADAQTQGLSQLCTRLGYDRGDRLTSVTQTPVGGVSVAATFAYDAHSRVSTVRTGCADAANCQAPASTYQYDDFGNLVRVQLPNSLGPVRHAYNARGNLIVKQTEAMRLAGEWQALGYDGLSRQRSATRHAPGSAQPAEVLYQLVYDNDGVPLPPTCSRYDGEAVDLASTGRLRYREDSFGRTWYRYDAMGRLVGEMRQRQGGASCNRMLETQYRYDAAGRATGLTYPYGRVVTYAYGTGARAHRVSSISVTFFTKTGGVQARPVVSHITWEPFGGLRGYQLNHSGGGASAVEYALGDDGSLPPSGCDMAFPSSSVSDLTGRLRSLRVSSGAFTPGLGSGDVYERTYTWKADQVVRTDTCLMGASVPRTELYAYDRTLRLTGATRPHGNTEQTGGAFQSQLFEYDRRGNRTSLKEGSRDVTSVYGTGTSLDQLLSMTPQHDALQVTSYAYDADGRGVRKESGRYSSGEAANVLDMSYGPAGASGRGSARESVFRTASVNGLTYQYFYDAFGRRRAKLHPFNGVRDEFFHDSRGTLLVDQGWKDVLQPGYRTVDDYVWLAGRPLLMVRGRLDASADTRLPDTSTECGRDGEPAACGERFMVTDHIGKPVLMLDGLGRVVGAADYQPFGHVNRMPVRDTTVHPYPDYKSESITGFTQPPETSLVQVRMRALYQFLDMQDDANGTDFVELVDSMTGSQLAFHSGPVQGRVVTDWVQPSAGSVTVNFHSSPAGPQPNAYTGVAVEAYEYQRYQVGAQPFWTPLRFPGQYHDAETDLFENWNRYYDPSVGRYLQPEPLLQSPRYSGGMAAGGYSVPAYAYALNNPQRYSDPNGLWVVGVGVNGTAHMVFFGFEFSAHVTVDGTGRMAVMLTPGYRVGLDINLSASLNLFGNQAPTVDAMGGWGIGIAGDCGLGSVAVQGALDFEKDWANLGFAVSPPGLGAGIGIAGEAGYSFIPISGQVF
ncbi:RHS repeat-associated core domain-containing protein [Pyxidicoccus sp. 3LG]